MEQLRVSERGLDPYLLHLVVAWQRHQRLVGEGRLDQLAPCIPSTLARP